MAQLQVLVGEGEFVHIRQRCQDYDNVANQCAIRLTSRTCRVHGIGPRRRRVVGGTGVVADSVIQQLDPSADPSSTKCQTVLNTSSPTATILRAQVNKNHD